MELQEYLDVLRRRWLMIALVAVLVMLAALAAGVVIPPRWESTVTLRVVPAATPATAYETILTADMLAKTYRELIDSDYVAAKAMETLFIYEPIAQFKRDISVELVPDTELIRVTASATTPRTAQAKATAVADAAIGYAKSSGMNDQVTVAVPALLPDSPVWPRPGLAAVVGLLFGAVLGAALALGFDYLGARVERASDLEDRANLTVIGRIPRLSSVGPNPNVFIDPHNPGAEHFRHLRTAILYSMDGQKLDSLVITSAEPRQGKTLVAANLGVALAKTGKRVLLVDADMRVPMLHAYFDLENGAGLSDYLRETATFGDIVRETGTDSLRIVTAGSQSDEPSELLGSVRLSDFLRQARSDADIVLIDSPPAVTVTDSVILAARADGVLLVVNQGQRIDTVRRATAALARVGARVIGAVLDRAEVERPSTGSGAGYYYSAGRSRSKVEPEADTAPTRPDSADGTRESAAGPND